MGVVTLSHSGRVFRFRVDPNAVTWTYNLNTKVEETYGGRVVQLLSIRLGDLVVESNSGSGGWPYLKSLIDFCRDVMFQQKETGKPAVFTYPTKGWELEVFLANLPYSDSVESAHFPFRLRFKIQEDVSGVMSSDSMTSELNKIRDGIGYERNDYNYPPGEPESDQERSDAGELTPEVPGNNRPY
jgi:hypothetical protein